METLEHKSFKSLCQQLFKIINGSPSHPVICLESFFDTRVRFFFSLLFLALWKVCFQATLMWPGVILYSYLQQRHNEDTVGNGVFCINCFAAPRVREADQTVRALWRSDPDLRLVNVTNSCLWLRLCGSTAPVRLHVRSGTVTWQGHGYSRKKCFSGSRGLWPAICSRFVTTDATWVVQTSSDCSQEFVQAAL